MSPASKSYAPLQIGGRTVPVTNLDKILWPDDGYTKGDLIAYYRTVAPYALPYLAGRPLTLERFPNGVGGESFFEKNAPRGLPTWVETVHVPSDHGRHSAIDFVVCNDEATLAYLGNLAAVVLHVWTSRAEALDVPEFLFFDLDPWEGCTLANLAYVTLAFRDTLLDIGLTPLVKSSGGSGLHILVPLAPRYDYAVCKQFSELIARRIHGLLPERTTLERMTAKRPLGTVYLDYVQVGKGKTMVAPFSVRARAKAPVSMPLEWTEVEAFSRKRAKGTSSEFERWTIRNVPALLGREGDPWRKAWKKQRLESALRRARARWTVTQGTSEAP
jgi:bifunctional non-homologous end joining protein LigD